MKNLLKAAALAAVATTASWAVKQWLDSRYTRKPRVPRREISTWEGEGGTLVPQSVTVETGGGTRAALRSRSSRGVRSSGPFPPGPGLVLS
jgi:hypothetical protein